MKNIFSFPKYSSVDMDKIIVKVLWIGGIILVCFAASLFVKGVVADRINRSGDALTQLNGLNEFIYDSTVSVRNTYSESASSMDLPVFNDVTLAVQDVTSKTLGRQAFSVFTGTAVSKGILTNTGVKDDSMYEIKLPKGTTMESVALRVNDVPFTQFTTIPELHLVRITPKNIPVDTRLELTYAFTGIRQMKFPTNNDTEYQVHIHPKTDNIRITDSSSGSYDKNTQTVTLNIKSYPTDSNLVFLSGTDDITFVDRIIKYAILFMVLVFSFALYIDLRKGLVINTIQYFLIGVSLALFYLLVLALGEQIGYTQAYIIASLGTAVLNMWYASEVLSSKKAGLAFGFALLVLYGILYYLMHVTSINLLLGTGILYCMLFLFMLGSKNLNKK